MIIIDKKAFLNATIDAAGELIVLHQRSTLYAELHQLTMSYLKADGQTASYELCKKKQTRATTAA